MSETLFGVCYLVVSKRQQGAYPGNELKFRVLTKRPSVTDVAPDEHAITLRVHVPRHLLEHISSMIDVKLPEDTAKVTRQ
jgi:hypothetical protein